MEFFTSRSWDHFPIFSAGSRSSHRDRFLPSHLPRFRARHAALGPRHHRCSHSSDLFFQLTITGFNSGKWFGVIGFIYLCSLIRASARGTAMRWRAARFIGGECFHCHHRSFFIPFCPPAIFTTTLCVSWRHRLRDICLNAALLFFKATSGVYSSSPQLYGSP